MKETSKIALDSIQVMIDYIRMNEQQSQKRYIVIVNAFGKLVNLDKEFSTKEEAWEYALRFNRPLQFVVCEEDGFHEEEKLPSPYL